MNTYPFVAGPDAAKDPTLAALLAQLQGRYSGTICCTLVYGSCLRSGDIYDGLLDLYLICDRYSTAYQSPVLAAANWLLPPNVFYAEQSAMGDAPASKMLRSKVTVISLWDFQRGCTPVWFESYIWGRFAQPTRMLSVRNEQIREQIQAALTQATHTLLRNALPVLAPEGSLTSLWERSLGLSYATELRTERSDRAKELAQYSRDFYNTMSHYHAPRLGYGFMLYEEEGEWHYRCQIGRLKRSTSAAAWALRRGQGKLLSIARVVKALFTFDGGLDYIAWKLQRHSGEEVRIPDKVRRAPLIYMWAFFWGLYRRGIFK